MVVRLLCGSLALSLPAGLGYRVRVRVCVRSCGGRWFAHVSGVPRQRMDSVDPLSCLLLLSCARVLLRALRLSTVADDGKGIYRVHKKIL